MPASIAEFEKAFHPLLVVALGKRGFKRPPCTPRGEVGQRYVLDEQKALAVTERL